MMKNCATKCDTCCKTLKKMYHTSSEPHLYLRTNTFYCRIELPTINKKRKWIRFSLRTTDYYEARQMIQDITDIDKIFAELNCLYKQVPTSPQFVKNDDGASDLVKTIDVVDDNCDKALLEKIKNAFYRCYNLPLDKLIEYKKARIEECNCVIKAAPFAQEFLEDKRDVQKTLSVLRTELANLEEHKKLYKSVAAIIIQIQSLLSDSGSHTTGENVKHDSEMMKDNNVSEVPTHTIQDVMDRMEIELKYTMGETTIKRKKQDIVKALKQEDISINDDYNKINSQKMINQIAFRIQKSSNDEASSNKTSNIGAQAINRKFRSINRLIETANRLEPEYYQLYSISLLKEKMSIGSKPRDEYLPFSTEELVKIFDIENPVFQRHPNIFWACMIALFCGARTNGATTLRYKDIITENGIICFDFKIDDEDKNDVIKRLKTNATVRKVPIHSKLIELGFLDYIERHRKKNKNNFLFPRVLTKNGTYNVHFMRPLFEYLKKIGIKKDRWKAFHSFRTNINKALRDCGVDETFRNDIVGWEGKTTPDRHYSTNSLEEIQPQLEKLDYDFLASSFAQWKEFMKNQ
ncbi:MAG: site-specific integrase [Alphaproteobacteria bacterium]|nr:site-specific integrase [Alphaproteobacteria bacterium]